MADYNPIRSIDGASVKCPSSYTWNLYDVSASDAGETESLVMDKKRIGQKTKIELEWANIKTSEVSKLTRQLNPQYMTVCFFDVLTGNYRTEEMYAGDRAVPAYNTRKGVWSLTVNLIGRRKR